MYILSCLSATSEIEVVEQVICGNRPFPGLRELAAANKLMEGVVPDRPEVGFPDSLWTKMRECLQLMPDGRPTVDDVLAELDKVLRG